MLAELTHGADMRTALGTGIRVASTVVGRGSRHRYPAHEELLPAADPAAAPATAPATSRASGAAAVAAGEPSPSSTVGTRLP
jgi:hypothetical protein